MPEKCACCDKRVCTFFDCTCVMRDNARGPITHGDNEPLMETETHANPTVESKVPVKIETKSLDC